MPLLQIGFRTDQWDQILGLILTRPGKRFTRSDPDPRISNPWDQTRFDPGSLLSESDGGGGGGRDGGGLAVRSKS
jgi:hypothetical protein